MEELINIKNAQVNISDLGKRIYENWKNVVLMHGVFNVVLNL